MAVVIGRDSEADTALHRVPTSPHMTVGDIIDFIRKQPYVPACAMLMRAAVDVVVAAAF